MQKQILKQTDYPYQAYCRIRPVENNISKIFQISQDKQNVILISNTKENDDVNFQQIFQFDYCFDQQDSQNDVNQKIVKPMIERTLIQKKNALIFTYGVSNSGKTHTIIGNQDGILYSCMQEVFDEQYKDLNIEIYLEIFEIYNEEIYDLTSKKRRKLELKHINYTDQAIKNLTRLKITDYYMFTQVLTKCLQNRSLNQTNINQHSSRAHTIFNIIRFFKQNNQQLIISVVDLAGSERQKRVDTKGKQYKESCNINSSLLVLDRCIQALKNNNAGFIPFRDSKLTQILQQYFQNPFSIQMIININPTQDNQFESLRSLSYAAIFKEIKILKNENNDLTSQSIHNDINFQELQKKEQQLINREREIQNQKLILDTNKFLFKLRELSLDSKQFHNNLFKQAYQRLDEINEPNINDLDFLSKCLTIKSEDDVKDKKKYIDQALSPINFGSQNVSKNEQIKFQRSCCKSKEKLDFQVEQSKEEQIFSNKKQQNINDIQIDQYDQFLDINQKQNHKIEVKKIPRKRRVINNFTPISRRLRSKRINQ